MMIIDKTDFNNLEARYRATLINSLGGVKQAVLIGTVSSEGQINLAIFNSLIHIGANPPFWGFIARPDVGHRHTLHNILNTGNYTINFPSADDYVKAHQTSAKYEPTQSEFDACGFTAVYEPGCVAPFVQEAPVKIAMKLVQKMDIELNGTSLVIGSIEQIILDESFISADGFVALDKANTLACAGLDAYYTTELKERLSYAKRDKWPVAL
jgi:flavin reductase (DIM6/NTAB) family NADH-FMN oxidoreductase RutF